MESNGGGSLSRYGRLESCFNTDCSPSVKQSHKIVAKKEVGQRPRTDDYVEDDGWIFALISCVRMVICFLTVMVTTVNWALIMLVLLPWPYERIRQGSTYGHLTGRLVMWILGNRIKIEGAEFSNKRAIYISNHASPLDLFFTIWLTPTGTVAIAKKEIIWYPLIGQLYVLAGHLRIDRCNPAAAIQSMNEGFVHLALQSRLPIVPIVLTGTHLAWWKSSLLIRPAPIAVKYLPPIRMDDSTADKIDDYVKMVHNIYVEKLPESQRPLALEGTRNSSS